MANGKRRRLWRVLLILAVIGIVLLVAADRIGIAVAESTVAGQARTQLAAEGVSTPSDPAVHIHGFPFLTQVLSGRYDAIDIAVLQPTTRGIRMDRLDVTATGVHVPLSTLTSGRGQIEADRVTGTAQVGWASFVQLVDLSGVTQYGIDPSTIQISGTDSGHINLSAPVTVEGATFTALATGTVTVAGSVLHVAITDISAADGPLPPNVSGVLNGIEQQLTFDVRIPPLPYHLVVDSVRTSAAGVTITASAVHIIVGS